MKTSLKMLVAAGLLSGAGALASAAPASAATTTHFSFSIGNVAMGYNDGYYDRNRRWHAWRNAQERNWYRAHYSRNFRSMRRDDDRDGIPNRFDRAPNNPYIR